VIGDARSLPFADREFDDVFASNILEHFAPEETVTVLREWMRVGLQLEVVVPDSMGILRDHFAGIDAWPACEERLRGSRDYPGNEHFACFTRTEFRPIAETAGLAVVELKSSHRGGGFTALLVRA
jgi:predicted SAM-dependent methyltransferase